MGGWLSSDPEREIARCVDFEFGVDYHGGPTLYGHFDYTSGGSQGFGYMVDSAFLVRFMIACGVHSGKLSDVNGRMIYVTHTHSEILIVEPIFPKDGTPFILAEWREWMKRNSLFSIYELQTGKKPPSHDRTIA